VTQSFMFTRMLTLGVDLQQAFHDSVVTCEDMGLVPDMKIQLLVHDMDTGSVCVVP
jgi:hypothetical protein